METLTLDALFSLAISMELPELFRFCSTSNRINNAICKKDNIWYYKLNSQFPNWKSLLLDPSLKHPKMGLYETHPKTLQPITDMKTPKDIYILLYWYSIFKLIKETLKIPQDIEKIYFLKYLYLTNKKITTIPNFLKTMKNYKSFNL